MSAEVLMLEPSQIHRGPGGSRPPAREAGPPCSGLDALTRTQSEILCLVAQGLTNSRIAVVRGISKKTVEMHIKNIYDVLGIEATTDQNARVIAAIRYTQVLGSALA